MTLSLDEVRNIRFPMARKPHEDGYRASAVDNFMDKLEISYAQIVEENEHLRSASGSSAASNDDEQLSELRSELEKAKAEASMLADEKAQLKQANTQLSEQVAKLTSQLDELRSSSDGAAAGNAQLQQEVNSLRAELEKRDATLAQLNGELTAARNNLGPANMAKPDQSQQEAAEQAKAADPLNHPLAEQDESGVKRIVVSTSAQASAACVRLVDIATQQAEMVLSDAKRDAAEIVANANAEADELTNAAHERADLLDRESRKDADKMLTDARVRASKLEAEVRDRRVELFEVLEADRDKLSERVAKLREFEQNYRDRFAGFLNEQIESLQNAEFPQGEEPKSEDMHDLGKPQVSTPRLDALVEESRKAPGA